MIVVITTLAPAPLRHLDYLEVPGRSLTRWQTRIDLTLYLKTRNYASWDNSWDEPGDNRPTS